MGRQHGKGIVVELLSSHDRPAQREKVMNRRTRHVKDSAPRNASGGRWVTPVQDQYHHYRGRRDPPDRL